MVHNYYRCLHSSGFLGEIWVNVDEEPVCEMGSFGVVGEAVFPRLDRFCFAEPNLGGESHSPFLIPYARDSPMLSLNYSHSRLINSAKT